MEIELIDFFIMESEWTANGIPMEIPMEYGIVGEY